jgi:CheY-like chemotaxis protein
MRVRPLYESKNQMPVHIPAARYGVSLIGFSEHERTLFASLFKLSGACREWKEGMEGKPDCILLDLETQEARDWYDRNYQRGAEFPIVAVGHASPATGISATRPGINATITRPLRWSGVLETLKSVIATSQTPGVAIATEPVTLPGPPEPDLALKGATLRTYKTIACALIVNPNPKGWRYITGELAARGYRVDHVSTGEAAVLLLANFRYNAVFVETHLPDEDGIGICRMLKQSQSRRKVTTIILSRHRKAVDRIRASFVGCDAILSAPVDADELHRTLDRLVPEYVLEQ